MRRRTWTGRGSPAIEGTIVCYAGARQIGAICSALASHGRRRRRTGGAHLRRDHAGAADGRRARSATSRRRRRTVTPALLVVGAVARSARAPALVRRSPAVRPPHRRDAIARAGGRVHRHARGTRRRGDPGADDPDRCRRRISRRSSGRARRPSTFDWIVFTSANGVDHFMRRAACVLRRARPEGRPHLHGRSGDGGAPRAIRHPRGPTPAEYRAEAVDRGAEGARPARRARESCCRGRTSPARCSAERAARRRAPTSIEVVAYRTVLASGDRRANTTSIGCCSTGRSTPSRSRARRPSATSSRYSAASRRPISCAPPSSRRSGR